LSFSIELEKFPRLSYFGKSEIGGTERTDGRDAILNAPPPQVGPHKNVADKEIREFVRKVLGLLKYGCVHDMSVRSCIRVTGVES